MNKKKKTVNRKHKKTKSRLKALKVISLKSKKKKVIRKSQTEETSNNDIVEEDETKQAIPNQEVAEEKHSAFVQ